MELKRALLAIALLLFPVAAGAQQTQSTVNQNVPPVGFFVEQSGPQFRDNFQRVINDLNVLFGRAGTSTARTRLTVNTTFFASAATGSDIPSCGISAKCASLNYLYNTILVPNYDINGKTVSLSIDSNDPTCVSLNNTWIGGGVVQLLGPGGSPPTIGLTCPGTAISVNAPLSGVLGIANMQLSGGVLGIVCNAPNLVDYANINFGAESFAHIQVTGPGCKVACTSNYTVSAGSGFHQLAQVPGANASCQGLTITFTGAPAFTNAFAGATVAGAVTDYNMTYIGSVTGARCIASVGGLVDTATGNPNGTLPGSSNCLVTSGGLIN